MSLPGSSHGMPLQESIPRPLGRNEHSWGGVAPDCQRVLDVSGNCLRLMCAGNTAGSGFSTRLIRGRWDGSSLALHRRSSQLRSKYDAFHEIVLIQIVIHFEPSSPVKQAL